VVVKLNDTALTVVALIGVTMMLVDVWQSLKSKDDCAARAAARAPCSRKTRAPSA
jgi:hypothetical protein